MYAAHSSRIWLYDVYIHSHIELLYIDVHLDTDTEDMDAQPPPTAAGPEEPRLSKRFPRHPPRRYRAAPRHAGFLWSERSKPRRAVQRPQGVGMDPAVENEIICKRTVMENPPCILGMDVP